MKEMITTKTFCQTNSISFLDKIVSLVNKDPKVYLMCEFVLFARSIFHVYINWHIINVCNICTCMSYL